MNRLIEFTKLHNDQMLILGNVWDKASAKVFGAAGFKAIGTSSAAIATSLGFEDGEQMPFSQLFRVVEQIMDVIDIPLSVDIEAGYSRDIEQIIANVSALVKLGVVGINIEDSVVDASRTMMETSQFCEIISAIKASDSGGKLFLNARTDAYIMGLDDPLEITKNRIVAYEKAGADGIFVPCVVKKNDIETLTDVANTPINVMCMPNLPNFGHLRNLGVKRVSMGPFAFQLAKGDLALILSKVIDDQSFTSLFG